MEFEIKRYVCRFCKGSFDQAENLTKHVLQIHTVRTPNRETRNCHLCGTHSLKPEDYKNHLRYIHGLSQDGQMFSFKSFNDFLAWKNETEKRNYCKFVLSKNPKVLPSKCKLHIYQCDSSKSASKHHNRSVISSKEKCPAMITAVESSKNRIVKVEYWNTHSGHAVASEEDELDAAINSLEVTEIVLEDDSRYQSDSSNSYFASNDNNEVSMSMNLVEESPPSNKGKRPTLFIKNKSSMQSEIPKFSFKKDPSKSVPSFQNSLASVACMKPKPKSQVDDTISSVISIGGEDITESTKNKSLKRVHDGEGETRPSKLSKGNLKDVSDSPSELDDSVLNETHDSFDLSEPASTTKASVNSSTPNSNNNESVVDPKKTASTPSSAKGVNLSNDGVASGQYIILNSTPGPNGAQNLLLCPVTVAMKLPKLSLQKELNPIIYITPSGKILADKDNSTSVKKIFSGEVKNPLKPKKNGLPGVPKSALKTISVATNLSGPVLMSSVGAGQTLMPIQNNLIPLGKGGVKLPKKVPRIAPAPPKKTGKPVTEAKTTATTAPIAPSVNPVTQIISSLGTALPPNAMPILIVPGTQSQILTSSPTVSLSKTAPQMIMNALPQVTLTPIRSSASDIKTVNFPFTSFSSTPISDVSITLSPKPIISTTVSNTVQSPKSSTAMSSFAGSRSTTSLISQMKQGILSQGSLCSPLPTPKYKSLMLECPTGGVYTLEPAVVDSKRPKTLLCTGKPFQISASSNLVKQDTTVAQDVSELPEDTNELPDVVTVDSEEVHTVEDDETPVQVKIDSTLKSSSPKKPDLNIDSIQIKSVVQEKRTCKEEDVEILKKVKYYQLEMKYLSSQAECKRLRLELAKAKMKNEAVESDSMEISTNNFATCWNRNKKSVDHEIGNRILHEPLSSVLIADESEDANPESVVKSVVSSIVKKVTAEIEPENHSMDLVDDFTPPVSDSLFLEVNEPHSEVKQKVYTPSSSNEELELHNPDLNKDMDLSELAEQVVEANNTCQDFTFQQQSDQAIETSQSLEQQYGQQNHMDVYTMIRTSVLRNLYDDMKGMCEENKKLFDELQRYRAREVDKVLFPGSEEKEYFCK